MRKKTNGPFSTRPKGAVYAVDPDAGLDAHTAAYKGGAPADDLLLDFLVDKYEDALKSPYLKGPEHAEAMFWEDVKGLAAEGLLTQAELDIMNRAKSGDLRAVQGLVKANSRIIRLPFVQDSLINVLRQQKYSTEKNGPALKYKWEDFLHARPKGKVMYAPENIIFLVERARDILNREGDDDEEDIIESRADVMVAIEKATAAGDDIKPDEYEAVAKELKISVDKVKKMTAIKGLRGRPKKE